MKYELQILSVLKMVFRESCSLDTPSLISKGGGGAERPLWENRPLPDVGFERVKKVKGGIRLRQLT